MRLRDRIYRDREHCDASRREDRREGLSGMERAEEGGVAKKGEKAAAEKVCRRCKVTFDTSTNTRSSCRFHPSFFVCRRHDDQKRYYELGPDDPPYAAKFYDCCGAEDPDALGCATDFHVSYDDD